MKSKLPDIGKISPEVFEELIYPRLGAKRRSVLVPPQNGVDVGIVEIGDQAVAMTTDPVFIVPEYGFERAAWFAIHILASDIVTSGLPPTYLSIDLNLPMGAAGTGLLKDYSIFLLSSEDIQRLHLLIPSRLKYLLLQTSQNLTRSPVRLHIFYMT